jgi:hypothetical protein
VDARNRRWALCTAGQNDLVIVPLKKLILEDEVLARERTLTFDEMMQIDKYRQLYMTLLQDGWTRFFPAVVVNRHNKEDGPYTVISGNHRLVLVRGAREADTASPQKDYEVPCIFLKADTPTHILVRSAPLSTPPTPASGVAIHREI